MDTADSNYNSMRNNYQNLFTVKLSSATLGQPDTVLHRIKEKKFGLLKNIKENVEPVSSLEFYLIIDAAEKDMNNGRPVSETFDSFMGYFNSSQQAVALGRGGFKKSLNEILKGVPEAKNIVEYVRSIKGNARYYSQNPVITAPDHTTYEDFTPENVGLLSKTNVAPKPGLKVGEGEKGKQSIDRF